MKRLLSAFHGLTRRQKLVVALMITLLILTWSAACIVLASLL